MSIALLLPRYDHPAIEERYANWQSQLLLRRSGARRYFYQDDERSCDIADAIADEYVLVVTDPLLLASAALPERLLDALQTTGAAAVLPVTNAAAHPLQLRNADPPYMTVRELEQMIAAWEQRPATFERVVWTAADPCVYLCRTELLDGVKKPPREVLTGQEVVISSTDYVHRWASMRGQVRTDLLDRIATDAKSVLEFGCGEGVLGEALKKRQRCRVVGIELDREAAALARRRLDDVYCADVREVVSILHEKFDWIVGGDIVEHLDDPWSFLSEVRRLSSEGGHLLLSLPNLSNASIVADLLAGRFDYVYMGLTCAGHLRFFTRHTIEEMLSIAGWSIVSITPQQLFVSPQADELMERLTASGAAFSRDDLTATGYYVIAQNL